MPYKWEKFIVDLIVLAFAELVIYLCLEQI
jgi:hypothetical protein